MVGILQGGLKQLIKELEDDNNGFANVSALEMIVHIKTKCTIIHIFNITVVPRQY